ncbi:hypothetical protein SK128_016671 [Halocaridina rubra]|uniref:Chitin-binding type-2 domain-containing protein n=1 Tax=Halocaridina rubra TaxID=373956 RepID=A0AAN8X569_HALRR
MLTLGGMIGEPGDLVSYAIIIEVGISILLDISYANIWKENVSPPPEGEKLGPLNSALPIVRFECTGRGGGYYGDMDFGCSVFHYCTTGGQRYTFRCSKGLKFNEITTSCSAGFFGDCTHPEIVGSAGRNMTVEIAPVKSFQNIPVFKGEENSFEEDPRDYPEPFIQHYDPALDLNFDDYDYQETDVKTPDAQTSASSQKEYTWDSDMRSALSAFASLVNMPFDSNSHNTKQPTDRMDRVESIERAFLARPPQRSPLIQRNIPGQFVKVSGFKNHPKKPTRHIHYPSHGQNLLPFNPPSLYPEPPHSNFDQHEEDISNPTSMQYQNIIPYGSEDYGSEDYGSEDDRSYVDENIHQTTPDAFRPSSLMTGDPEEFQPVTQKAKAKTTEHVRPYREATPQSEQNSFPQHFQSFSPTQGSFTPPRFSGQTSFGGGLPPPQRIINTTPQVFLPPSNFPSSGNFVFNQPPVHPAIFNPPFRSVAAPSGPPVKPPRQPTHSESSFEHSSPEHHTQIIRPRPSSERHFTRPTSEQHFGNPPIANTGQRFISSSRPLHNNPIIHSQNINPVTSQPIPTFIHQTTPGFHNPPVRNSLLTGHPISTFNRPTIAPTFITATSPAAFNTPRQNPFGLQQERPLLESFPKIIQHATDFPARATSTGLSHEVNNPRFPFEISSTPKSLVSTVPSRGSSEFSEDIHKESQSSEREPESLGNIPASFDPRPSRRRRPNPLQPSVTNFRPTSRPLRQNSFNTHPHLNPTLVTGLENSAFHSPFLPPANWPGSQSFGTGSHSFEGENVDTYTIFDDTQLRETDATTGENLDTKSKFENQITHTLVRATTEKSIETGNRKPVNIFADFRVSEEENDNVVDHVNDFNTVSDNTDTEQTTSTRTPFASTETITPSSERTPVRQRPNIRKRLRTRLGSRTTTTPEPTFSEENVVIEDRRELDNEPSEDKDDTPREILSTTTSTTLSPFKQRVRDRLNKLKNSNQNEDVARITTAAPTVEEVKETEKASSTTTASPTSLRGGLDSERFQRYRNSLRNRFRNSRTTEKPAISEEDTKKENNEQRPSNAAALLTNLRNGRITSQRNQENNSEDENAKNEEVLEKEEIAMDEKENQDQESKDSALQVKDILNSDQQTEETRRHSISKEAHTSVDYPEYSDAETENDNTKRETSAQEHLQHDTEITSDNPDEDYSSEVQETRNDTISDPELDTEEEGPIKMKGKRIINPNVRARFREFIRNRKNRLSSSYTTTTPTPESSRDTQNQNRSVSTESPETSTLSFKERMEQFNQNRQSIRQRFLANRQANDDERSSRRLPLRPLRNKIPNIENEEEETNKKDEDKAGLRITSESESNKETESSQTTVRNRVIDGFAPSLHPIHVRPPSHIPFNEPEIITAAPGAKIANDNIFSVKVATSLAHGKTDLTQNENKKIGEMDMIQGELMVKEIKKVDTVPTQKSEESDASTMGKSISEAKEEHGSTDLLPLEEISSPTTSHEADEEEQRSEQIQQQESDKTNGADNDFMSPSEQEEMEDLSIQKVTSEDKLEEDVKLHTTDVKLDTSKVKEKSDVIASEHEENHEKEKDLALESLPQPTKASKPTFNFGVTSNKNKNNEEAPISASDLSEELLSEDISPVPLLPITMSTDAPRLPLEMLLPLFNR